MINTLSVTRFSYKNLIKPIFFKIDPETVHTKSVKFGQLLGKSIFAKKIFSKIYIREFPLLRQEIFGIDFKTPVGLAAGFDYEGRLTQILPTIGFGFGTVGTLTHLSYEGNRRPMLGRLPKSKSLVVNKGFKNFGIKKTLESLDGLTFSYPVGISIGKTNTLDHKTQEDGVRDVVMGFEEAEKSNVPFKYYELNISCPNLHGPVEFYSSQNLRNLLIAIEKINIKKPVFVKMPITKSDEEIISIMNVIIDFKFIKAVIIGNLQGDRNNPNVIKEEQEKFPRGGLSGLPCQSRSDELIRLLYRRFGKQVKVIGCGGIFNAEDAYRKIRLGSSLLQLITGMVFEGPQLIAEINRDLEFFLRRDGFKSISDAVGLDT